MSSSHGWCVVTISRTLELDATEDISIVSTEETGESSKSTAKGLLNLAMSLLLHTRAAWEGRAARILGVCLTSEESSDSGDECKLHFYFNYNPKCSQIMNARYCFIAMILRRWFYS